MEQTVDDIIDQRDVAEHLGVSTRRFGLGQAR